LHSSDQKDSVALDAPARTATAPSGAHIPARVILVTSTTGYQTRAFLEAAAAIGVDVRIASDRCFQLDNPWGDRAIPVRFHQPEISAQRVAESEGQGAGSPPGRETVPPAVGQADASQRRTVAGSLNEERLASAPTGSLAVFALGDSATVTAAAVARRLGLRYNSIESTRIARNKYAFRCALRDAQIRGPQFVRFEIGENPWSVATRAHRELDFPCVLKPLVLSGSRGVVRADDEAGFIAAWERIRALLASPGVRQLRDPGAAVVLVEQFIPGREFALEAVLENGELWPLAIFDKPDPLDGPFFEETIYVTPSRLGDGAQQALVAAVQEAVAAIGLRWGPVHAEVRLNERGAYVLEVAARPIGGLCARVLRFSDRRAESATVRAQTANQCGVAPGLHEVRCDSISLDAVLLRHALGEHPRAFVREDLARAVMMIPIERGGILAGVEGVERALKVPGITGIEITAKPDQRLVPLPEGASYLGFIFAAATAPADAEAAVRRAHACLEVHLAPSLPVIG
jgi:hypothetical protein